MMLVITRNDEVNIGEKARAAVSYLPYLLIGSRSASQQQNLRLADIRRSRLTTFIIFQEHYQNRSSVYHSSMISQNTVAILQKVETHFGTKFNAHEGSL